jgi:hypothetical protein
MSLLSRPLSLINPSTKIKVIRINYFEDTASALNPISNFRLRLKQVDRLTLSVSYPPFYDIDRNLLVPTFNITLKTKVGYNLITTN